MSSTEGRSEGRSEGARGAHMSAQKLHVGQRLLMRAESRGAQAALAAAPRASVAPPQMKELIQSPWEVRALEERTAELEYWRVSHPLWGEATLKAVAPKRLSDDEVMWRFNTDLELTQLQALKLSHIQRPLCWGQLSLTQQEGELTHPWGVLLSAPQGQRLSERLKSSPLSLREAHQLFVPLAYELARLHEHGLLHRAVQPDHLHLTAEGPVLVRQHWEAEVKALERATAAELLRGESSPQHKLMAAPEWFEGGDLTSASDVYALAVTLLSALNPKARSWRDAPSRYRAPLAERLSPQPSARGEMFTFAQELEISALTFEYKSSSDDEPERLALAEVVERVREDELGWHLVSAPLLEGQPYQVAELSSDEFVAWGQVGLLAQAVERARLVSATLEDASKLSALVERNATLEAEAEQLKRERLALIEREQALTRREEELADRLEAAQATMERVEHTKREVEEELQRRYVALKEAHDRAEEQRRARQHESEDTQQRLVEARDVIRQKRKELEASEAQLKARTRSLRQQLAQFERAEEALKQREDEVASLAERTRVLMGEAESERSAARKERRDAKEERARAEQLTAEVERERERALKQSDKLAEERAELHALREAEREQLKAAEAQHEEARQAHAEAVKLRAEAEELRATAERERQSAEAEHARAARLRSEAEALLEEAQQRASGAHALKLSSRAPRSSAPHLGASLTPISLTGQTDNPQPGARLELKVGELSLFLRFCPAGRSQQGSAEGEGKPEEHPQHSVFLSRPYWLAETPVYQALWQLLMGAHPSKHQGPQLPVEGLAWASAARFCNVLSEQMGLEPAYEVGEGARAVAHLISNASGWRLPTEAEWEHAARAQQQHAWRYAGGDKLDELGWFSANANDQAQPVAQKTPNAWGLHDMSGGVWEWCQDVWSRDAYRARVSAGEAGLTDPLNDALQPLPRVIRGGSFYDYPMSCRVAARPALETSGGYGVGFRPLLPA